MVSRAEVDVVDSLMVTIETQLSHLCQHMTHRGSVQYPYGMSEHSAAAERTRRAIIEAGIEVLASNPRTPLAEIAAKAAVSRSTFHRYFPDRAALKTAISEVAEHHWQQAIAAARLEEGTGLEAFRRLCSELVDNLDVLIWWMTELGEPDTTEESQEDRMIAAAIARGHQDGSIDPQLSVEWISNVVWSVLYAVRYVPPMAGISAFEARQQALRTLMKATAADPSSV